MKNYDKENKSRSKGWFHGKNLPHLDEFGKMQFITIRLCDSLPLDRLKELKELYINTDENNQEKYKYELIENMLDTGYGCCALASPEMAEVMQNALFHFDGSRYKLISWCIMPNHVHVLIKENYNLSLIIKSWKSFTGRWAWQNLEKSWLPEINIVMDNEGSEHKRKHRFWMDDYWDRYIRSNDHFQVLLEYIHNNPAKAGLVESAEDWKWSSARLWLKGKNKHL